MEKSINSHAYKMKTKSESFVVHYPEAVTFADEQIKYYGLMAK